MKTQTCFFVTVLLLIHIQTFVVAQDSLIINEFMAINNNSIQDEDSTHADWIEIYNGGSDSVNLMGWYLTDDPDDFYKWAFPDMIIEPHEYLIVYASDKNRRVEKDKLHTNFKLSGSGEFLALSNPGISKYNTLFNPIFPEQFGDISYAYFNGEYNYSSNPTPGEANDTNIFLTPPTFSKEHGFYDEPFMLELSSDQERVDIYYTTDASTPSASNGILYTGPVNISATTTVRAIAVVEGNDPGAKYSASRTYIFLQDVLDQSEEQEGYPDTWLMPSDMDTTYVEIQTDYGMQQDILARDDVNAVITESLKSLPVISIVTDIEHLFSKSTHPDSGGIYMYSGEPDGLTRYLTYHLGRGWTRPASIEYFNAEAEGDNLSFQENGAIRIHGGASRSTRKTLKRSFKLGFISEYGPTKLREEVFGDDAPDQYDWLILRGGFDRRLGQQICDPWAKSTMRDMGQNAGRSKFVHVYLNGMYWGMYNLSEQLDENYMRDNFGGDKDDYDIIKDYYEVEAGDTIAWDKLVAMAADNIQDTANYQKLLGNNPDGSSNPSYEKMLNPENLIDYIMMYMYASISDWDLHNWVAARRKTNSEGFHFLVWDAEYGLYPGNPVSWIMEGGNENRPTGVFADLMENQQFRDHFTSRVNEHFFEGGALTPDPSLKRYEKWLGDIDTALIADQTRWVADEDDIWNKEYHSFIYDYFPDRTENVFQSFVEAGIYPEIETPEFNTENTTIPDDFQLYLSQPENGEVLYTLDGTDPGHYHSGTNSSIQLYDGSAFSLPADGGEITIATRTKMDTLWSTLVKTTFTIGEEVSVSPDELQTKNHYFYNFPNPVVDRTNIVFSLPETTHVRLRIYNTMGELVAFPVDEMKRDGEHTVVWNAENHASGIYFGVMEMEGAGQQQIKIVKE